MLVDLVLLFFIMICVVGLDQYFVLDIGILGFDCIVFEC